LVRSMKYEASIEKKILVDNALDWIYGKA
jgi:hypothetical protein